MSATREMHRRLPSPKAERGENGTLNAFPWPMDKDPAMTVMVKGSETGRGKRSAFIVAVVLVVVALIGVVAAGFRGKRIPQSAAALTTTPATTAAKTGWRPWWLQ
jgi:hypothetical protein